jgi:hypothetical protein
MMPGVHRNHSPSCRNGVYRASYLDIALGIMGATYDPLVPTNSPFMLVTAIRTDNSARDEEGS